MTTRFFAPPSVYETIPGLSAPRKFTCIGSTPNSPSLPGAMSSLTSASTTGRSGVTILRRMSGGHLPGLLDGLLDRADHVERLLGQVVVLARHELLERADGVLDLHVRSRGAGEGLGDVEGLRQEALHLAGAGDQQLVVFRELVHAENRDDVLQI